MIHIKRAYDIPEKHDGYRVLVDRLWPRGKTKESMQLDQWLKELAPSNELRKWFNHDIQKYPAFKEKYLVELQQEPAASAFICLKELAKKHQELTLIYSAKDRQHNQAVVLKELLEK